MSLEIAVPIQNEKRLQNGKGDVLDLKVESTLQGRFSARAWPGPFGIEFQHPSYMQVEFRCVDPDRPFLYRGVLRAHDFLFLNGERAMTARPSEPSVESIDTIKGVFDYRREITLIIDGETATIWVRLMGSYFTVHLCPSSVLVHCRFFDVRNCRDYREIWYYRSYESLLFTNAPRFDYDREGNPVEYFTREADYVDFELL